MPNFKETNLTMTVDSKRLFIHRGNQIYLLYVHDSYAYKPHFVTLIGPSGHNIIEDSPPDHIHHHGIWWAHGDVNGIDFYLELPQHNPGRIVHMDWETSQLEENHFRFNETLNWIAPDGEVIINERRDMKAHFAGIDYYFLDFDSTFTANIDIRFGTTKESGLPLMRIAEALNGIFGGIITASTGKTGEQETFGQPAEWIDYSGKRMPVGKEPMVEGIACFDHPENFAHPNRWFTRAYGPFSPFEGHHFVGETQLAAGDSFRLRFRLYIHAGDYTQAQVAQRYEEWKNTSSA